MSCGEVRAVCGFHTQGYCTTWPWLHYQTHNPDNVFCYVCVSALKFKRMDQSRDNLAFTSNGFKNWKDATISFKIHEASARHKEALQVVVVARKFASGASEKICYVLTNPKMLPLPLDKVREGVSDHSQ